MSPVLIFVSNAVDMASSGLPVDAKSVFLLTAL
jgi:hypothetical protein